MKQIIFLILIIFLLLCNESVFIFFKIFSTAPNFLALLVIVSVFFGSEEEYLWLGFFGGLFLDFFSGLTPGTFSLGLPLAGYCIWLVDKKLLVLGKSPWFAILGLLFFVFIYSVFAAFYSMLMVKFGRHNFLVLNKEFFIQLFVVFVYNLLFFYPVYKVYMIAEEFILKLKPK